MSLGLSASVLVVPLLLVQGSSSNTVLNGIINTGNSDSLTAFQMSGTAATVLVDGAKPRNTTQPGDATTVVNNLAAELHPQISTLVYDSISVVPADKVVVEQTFQPNTLIAPSHAVLPPPPPPPRVVTVHYVAPVVRYDNSRVGPASWYAAPFGTCANTWLPFGTIVHVTNLSTGASTTCRVEDRGPYIGGRILDLSEGTFSQIANTGQGVVNIKMEW